jgi:hypothetical protein
VEKENLNYPNRLTFNKKASNIMKSSQMNNPIQINDLIEKKPMTSSITITALDDHPKEALHSPTARYMQKASMMSPIRAGGISHEKMNIDNKMMKKSSFYQYELEHKRFMSSNEEIINENEFEDSPTNNKNRKFNFKKFPSLNS